MTHIQMPGLIDPHVHLREPGQTHKEDFDSGTAAALAGGFTAVLAMPNTQPPITDEESLDAALRLAQAKARCDVGVYVGATANNATAAARLAGRAAGLKLYCDGTFGSLRLEGLASLQAHAAAWPAGRPLAAHAEGRSLAAVLLLAALYDRPVHICHVSRADEIRLIRKAKERGVRVTCEVTPHHLFLSEDDIPRIGPGRSEVRPRLATPADREALWQNLDVIDCFATDHAPHALAEKDGHEPPPGFPGLETALGLFLTAVAERRLTLGDVVDRMHTNVARVFGLASQGDTHIEVDPDARWEVRAAEMNSRCGWTPWEGMTLRGRVRRVTLRGREAFADGNVISPPGSGRILSPETLETELEEA
ncbi:MAG: amidohydrolase family protein [Anaerolineales bacterium]